VVLTDGMRFKVTVTCGGAPRVRQGVREAQGLQQRCAHAADGIVTPPTDLRHDGTRVMSGRHATPTASSLWGRHTTTAHPGAPQYVHQPARGDDAATSIRASACFLLPSYPYSTSRRRRRLRRGSELVTPVGLSHGTRRLATAGAPGVPCDRTLATVPAAHRPCACA
jgi:hypothetical protein